MDAHEPTMAMTDTSLIKILRRILRMILPLRVLGNTCCNAAMGAGARECVFETIGGWGNSLE